jgi:tRNA-specific 2-thiouridylase
MNKKVIVGFSGGKDSTAAVLILKKQGYHVQALNMKVGVVGEEARLEKIKHLADILEVPLIILDMRKQFQEKVVEHFLNSYASGRTPNPCVECNNEIKFKLLFDHAIKVEKADFFATGHYADRVCKEGHWYLKEPVDHRKSQIYFLSMIGSERLSRILFPIHGLKLEEVRQLVKGLPLGNKKESQDVCFLGDEKLVDFLRKHIPEKFEPGDILDVDGNRIGTHDGAIFFTIGQRRGTNFSSDRKLYVVKKDLKNNTITLGDNKYLFTDSVEIGSPVFWKEIREGDEYRMKIRYLCNFYDAQIIDLSKDFIKAKLKNPAKSVTPGQIGAFYQDDIIVASGYIE